MIGYQPRRDSEEPGRERRSSPLKLSESRQGFPEDFGGQVFGLMTIADAPHYVGIDAMEVLLVQVAKARGVALRGFDPQPVIGALRHRPPGTVLVKIIHGEGGKVTAGLAELRGRGHLIGLPDMELGDL